MQENQNEKESKERQSAFSCTPAQRIAALKFVEHTIEIQEIVAAGHSGEGCDDILLQINAEYQASVDRLLLNEDREQPSRLKIGLCPRLSYPKKLRG